MACSFKVLTFPISTHRYVVLIVTRILQLVFNWIPRGLEAILSKMREGLLILTKTAIAGIVLLGVIPLLIGILFDVVIIVPLRVPLNQTPIFYLWQDWAFGVLHTKVICGIAMSVRTGTLQTLS